MAMNDKLFEVSWEVCHFVGAINTVLRTKAAQAIANFKEYIMIGPWLPVNDGFVENNETFPENIVKLLQEQGLKCKFGYWDIPGKPKVILVAYPNDTVNDILYMLWRNYGVESHAARDEYIEPVLFATFAATVIDAIAQQSETESSNIFAHFHEWRAAAGLLYLRKNRPDISNIFTIYGTVMGRALSSQGVSIFALPSYFDFSAEASKMGLLAKHTLEKAAAHEADSYTTVSYIGADESNIVLKEYPDKITFNGLAFDAKNPILEEAPKRVETRKKLLEIARYMTKQSLTEDTRIWITGGRGEFHNKGYDVLLSSLANLEEKMGAQAQPIVVFFCVALKRSTQTDRLVDIHTENKGNDAQILTHRLDHQASDPLLKMIMQLNFENPNRKIHIIFCPAYLTGDDGVFDVDYMTLVSACDLSLYPVFFEPWGYAPLESIGFGVPAITTDLSGFSGWLKSLGVDFNNIVYPVERRGIPDNDFINNLTQVLQDQINKEISPNLNLRLQSHELAKFSDWTFLYKNYCDAYEQAVDATTSRINEGYISKFGIKISEDILKISSRTSKIRAVSAEQVFPHEFQKLIEYSYNLWWSWQLNGYQLFAYINPVLWVKVKGNPVKLLNAMPRDELKEKIKSEEFVKTFNQSLQDYEKYSQKYHRDWYEPKYINDDHPIAYFCMEYGLDKSLPLYSGGLGILAGDFLKTASDLQIPLVAFGLFYKFGFFNQAIDDSGYQVAKPDFLGVYNEPLVLLKNKKGKEITIGIEVPGRTCYFRIWQVNVGLVRLYLFDSDTHMNNDEDRKITSQLYPIDIETRLLQCIILGIGGVKFIDTILKIHPCLYHMNECHTAFFLLERLQHLVDIGYGVRESVEIVRKTTVYTIHTPVLAAQEIYLDEIIKKYFLKKVQNIGIDFNDFVALGRTIGKERSNFFSLTASAIRSSYSVNGVSKLHGQVSQKLWHTLWPDALEVEVPITSVTNGIHLQTWLGSSMWHLFNKYFPENWLQDLTDRSVWQHVYKIPDAEIWEAHQTQKNQLLTMVKEKVLTEYIVRSEDRSLVDKTLNHLNSNPFIIVFSRRVTQYKRPGLIFKNPERLASILSDPKRPAILLVAGKAHPSDGIAREIIHDIVMQTRQKSFDGRVIFLEDYDMWVSRFLVTGADLWLNNPIFGMEACGTSGMKASMNGVLNYSVRDGWWHEAYTPDIGWEVDTFKETTDELKRDAVENYLLLNKLEFNILRTYYNKDSEAYSKEWVQKMKHAIAIVGYQFNSQYMMRQYWDNLYVPAAKRFYELTSPASKIVPEYIKWKNQICKCFPSITVKSSRIHVLDKLVSNVSGPVLSISLTLDLGELTANDIVVELLLMKNDQGELLDRSFAIPLNVSESKSDHVFTYVLKYEIEENGFYAYAIRITPFHPLLRNVTEMDLVQWI